MQNTCSLDTQKIFYLRHKPVFIYPCHPDQSGFTLQKKNKKTTLLCVRAEFALVLKKSLSPRLFTEPDYTLIDSEWPTREIHIDKSKLRSTLPSHADSVRFSHWSFFFLVYFSWRDSSHLANQRTWSGAQTSAV